MSDNDFSRRNFLAGAATTGTLAALSETNTSARPNADGSPIRIVCSEALTAAEMEQLRSAGKNVELVIARNRTELKQLAPTAEVIMGSLDGETLAAAKNLKWFQGWGAGVEWLYPELIAHPSVMTNMQRIFSPVIAETAIGLLLSLTRGLTQDSIPNFKEHKYQAATVPLEDLHRKTIGIVGMGGIGSDTARRLHYGFDMRVLATDPKPMPKPEFVAELREPAWLMEMIPQVDVLMSAAPLTKETRAMFNDAVFARMKPTAYFLNVSRGGLVDQEALMRALKEKRIRGAGLDVTTPEPLPPDHPLWNCPNLVITPHNSGAAPIRQVRLMGLVAENVRRYSHGLPLLNVVDKARGY